MVYLGEGRYLAKNCKPTSAMLAHRFFEYEIHDVMRNLPVKYPEYSGATALKISGVTDDEARDMWNARKIGARRNAGWND